MEKKLFKCSFTEYNGEQEYSYTKLVRAEDENEAKKILIEYLKYWYEDDEDAEPIIEDGAITGYEFIGGCVIVSKIYVYGETTKEEFMEQAYADALIS